MSQHDPFFNVYLLAMLWESECRPTTLGQVAGHDAVKHAMQEWLKKPKRKPALVHGPTGIGKTSLSMALLQSYSVWDDSMLPDGDSISDAVDILLHRKSLTASRRAIVIDLEGMSDRGALLKHLKGEHVIPIVLTCDDLYDFQDYQRESLMKCCEMFSLSKPSMDQAKTTLLQCMKRLDVPLSTDSASMVLDISQGNVRNALNTLQFMVSTKKRKRSSEGSQLCDTSFTDKGSNLFEDAQRLCCGYVRDDSFELAASDSGMSFMMLQHNLPTCVPSLKKLGDSLESFSFADLMADAPYYLIDQAVVQSVLATATACKGARSTRLQFPNTVRLCSQQQARAKKLIYAGTVTVPSTTLGVTMSQLKPSAMQALENLHVLMHIKHKDKDIQSFRKDSVKKQEDLMKKEG